MDNSLQKLQRLLNLMDSDPLTKESFMAAFKAITEKIKADDEANKRLIADLKTLLETRMSQVDSRYSETDSLSKQTIESLKADIIASLKKGELTIAERLALVKDGEDADEERVAEMAMQMVIDRLFIPSTEDILNDIPQFAERVRDALELLKGDERLDARAVKGLKKLIKDVAKLDKSVQEIKGSATTPSPVSWPRHESFTMNGSDTSVTLTQAVGAAGTAIFGVRYQGQVLDLGNQYTVDGNQINFDFTPINGSTISVSYFG